MWWVRYKQNAVVIPLVVSLISGISAAVQAQDSAQLRDSIALPPIQSPSHLTLIGAIELSRRNYPSIRMAGLQAAAAREGITQAKTAFLPHIDLLLDENYGTSNNITGFLAPQNIVPNISGQANNKNDFQGGFGFTTGGLVSWQPFDFGLRKAQVNVAQSSTKQAQTRIALSELQAMSQSAESFLSVLAAQQVLKAAQAKVDRLKVFLDTVHVLAQKQIKPATDEFLAQAEMVQAQDEEIAAEQNNKVALAALWRWTGIQGENVDIDAGLLIKQVPENHFTVADPYLHPQALVQQAAIDLVRAQKHALERSYVPQFYLRLPVYARGSSFQPDLSLNFHEGYYPTKFNYAISALVLFQAMDIFTLKAQRRQAEKNELVQRAQLDEIVLNLKQQDAQSRAIIEGATRIANNAPLKVRAAQEAAQSATVRYQHQLASVNDVAQTQQLLTKAQVDYATAQLQVWRAYLASALARGDMKPFIDQVSQASLERK